MELFTEQQLEAYSLALLRWAYGKTGSRTAAEDLSQEVWMQLYQSMHSGTPIHQPERYLWKIARYVWCRHLRSTVYCGTFEPLEDHPLAAEENDPAQQHAEEAEKAYFLQKMRKKLMELNRYQREIMIRYYIEGQPQKDIAQELGLSVSTVKWHLFDTRQRLKEELMENNEFVYTPRKLHLAISGSTPDFGDVNVVNASLSKQNICIASYRKPKTVEELSRMLGIPREYVENDLQWMVEKEMMEKCENGYRPTFLITNSAEKQEKYAVYLKMKETLSDMIVQGLLAAQDKIRAICFQGSSQPMNKLLWLLIYQLAYSLIDGGTSETVQHPLHSDGGCYHLLGFAEGDEKTKTLDTCGWRMNGSMYNSEGYVWYGMEHFSNAEPVKLFSFPTGEWKRLQATLLAILKGRNALSDLDAQQKEDLAALIAKGFVKLNGGQIVPCFCTFTKKEYEKLKTHVFWPIARKLAKTVQQLHTEMENLCRRQLPAHLQHELSFATHLAKYDLGWLTTFFAYQDGQLHIPQSEQEGAMLTLAYIRPEAESN